MAKTIPSMDAWLAEAKKDESAAKVGMYLVHNGVVREGQGAPGRRRHKAGYRHVLFLR